MLQNGFSLLVVDEVVNWREGAGKDLVVDEHMERAGDEHEERAGDAEESPKYYSPELGCY